MTYKRWQGPTRPVANGAAVLRLTLGSNEDAPGHARAALARLGGETNEDVFERAVLLTSELVTNSVKHAGSGEIRVDIWPTAGSIAVVVTDDGPGFVPVPQHATVSDQDGGFGLPLLDTLSEAWGSGYDGEAWVWFEVSPRIIARPPPVPARQPAMERAQLLDIRMLVDSIKNRALVALDAAGNVTNWGAGAVALTGYSAEEVLGQPFAGLYVQASERSFERERAAAEYDGWHRVQRWIRRKEGSAVWVELELAPIVDGAGNRRGLSALITDATEHKRVHDSNVHLISELREQAMTDDLTGLPNRRCWIAELNRELARSRRHGTPLAIVMLDLNGFKAFNDEHGHPAGDDLLRAVARDWSEAVRGTDMLARFGGDEFAISLPDCSPELAIAVVGRVRTATSPRIDSSAGIASSDGVETADALVGRADAALYDAKRQGQAVSVAVTNP
jgi:diguanylate cyclase (GGDEF)-like protein/PAS domain S-box-containing protein